MTWTVDSGDVAPLIASLEALLDDEARSIDDLTKYFSPDGGYSGGKFELLGRDAHGSDEIGCHDLLSLNLLDVPIPGPATWDLLMDVELRDDVTRLLGEIDDEDLWEASEDTLNKADELWELLRGQTEGMADTRLSKLLHRKRPHLIPISDSVIIEALPLPDGVPGRWSGYRTAFQLRTDLVENLEGLRESVPTARHVSLLRALDVIAWMRDRGSSAHR
jgi:hypothetical protein